MSRFARSRRVFFFEEPELAEGVPRLRERVCETTGVRVCTPILPHNLDRPAQVAAQRELLNQLLASHDIRNHIAWYYTPMAREVARHLKPRVVVYDCMDELSAFAGAPPEMKLNEHELLEDADLVFTGGVSLYESKRKQHDAVHAFPSSVDVAHFATARLHDKEPADQAAIPHPRIGYAGVLDERLDVELLRQVAARNPRWHFVLIGPTCKIDPATLPQGNNLHYLGMKPYAELPAYFSGWEIGMLPFALNESTRFISPTKTPEYLAAGLRVVSSAIRDVARPYGELGLVEIFGNADEFTAKVKMLLEQGASRAFRANADAFLAHSSWESTWRGMNDLIEQVVTTKSVEHAAHNSMEKVAYV